MTLDGTNGYIVRVGPQVLVAIDPGPVDDAQRDAFVAYAKATGSVYGAILVTHGHPDHAPGAAPLSAATGAPVMAHPDELFPHDRALGDNERLPYAECSIAVLHTPGHAPDHLVFVLEGEQALFTGDVVAGSGFMVIAPPHGDMRVYQATLRRLRERYGNATSLYGGHGPEVRDVRAKLDEYIAHRETRERQIVAALETGDATIPELVAQIYAETPRALWPAAGRQVLAYVIALEREGRVASSPLERAPSSEEAAILNPDLSKLDANAGADVIRAELGFATKEPLLRYALRR